jgi:hypothetical protein
MASVYQELCELGYYTVRDIEEHINAWEAEQKDMFILEKVQQEYDVSEDTAIMLVAGARNYVSSRSIKDVEQ